MTYSSWLQVRAAVRAQMNPSMTSHNRHTLCEIPPGGYKVTLDFQFHFIPSSTKEKHSDASPYL